MTGDRDLSSSTLFYRELDVVPRMSGEEEARLLGLQSEARLEMLGALMAVPRGRRAVLEPVRDLLEGGIGKGALLDPTWWETRHGELPEAERRELESMASALEEDPLPGERLAGLHLSWSGVERAGRELFSATSRCEALLERRESLLSREGGSTRERAVGFCTPVSGDRSYGAWLRSPALQAVTAELEAFEVRTGCPVADYFAAAERFSGAMRYQDGILERLVEANLRLVVSIARRYYTGSAMEEMDLVQEGCRGLMTAARRFDPDRGSRFSTYAVWWIRQAILRSLSRMSRVVTLPRSLQEEQSELRRAEAAYTCEHGRRPDDSELAEYMGTEPERVTRLRSASAPQLSLDGTCSGEDCTLADFMAAELDPPDGEAVRRDRRRRVREALADLSEREKTIVALRFGLDGGDPCTLQQLGDVFGVSRERIRQIESGALAKLRRHGLLRGEDG